MKKTKSVVLRTMIAVFAICFSFIALVGCGEKKQPAAEITFSEYVNKPEASPVSIEIVYSSSHDGRTAYAPVTNEKQMQEIYGILEGYVYELHEGEYLPPPGFMRSIKITYDDSSTVSVSIFIIEQNDARYVAKDSSQLWSLTNGIVSEYESGLSVPDFTLSVYGGKEGETFTLSEHYGKVTVVNFWASWCASCIVELPYFEQLQQEFPDDVTVIAIHESISGDVNEFIERQEWDEYAITFAQDEMSGASGKVCNLLLRDPSLLPATAILNQEGRVEYILGNISSYQTLKGIVEQLIDRTS